MVDETTPLNSSREVLQNSSTPTTFSISSHPLQTGPAKIFPGVPRRRERRKHRVQCCFCIFLLLVVCLLIVFALLMALNVTPPWMNWQKNDLTNVADVIDHTGDKDRPREGLSNQKKANLSNFKPLQDEAMDGWSLKHSALVNNSVLEAAVKNGIKALGDRELLEEGLQSLSTSSPAFRYYRSLNSNPQSRKLARRGYVENQATLYLAHMVNYTRKPGSRNTIGQGPLMEGLSAPAEAAIQCNFNARYRYANGQCNNKENPHTYGAAFIPYRRMLQPDYNDGISIPRGGYSYDNSSQIKIMDLPPAREVSLRIHRASYDTDSNFTIMLAVFGQFLDHDITATASSTLQEGESLNCCEVNVMQHQHPECFPVSIDVNDPYYSQFNITCMNFLRSAPAPTGHFQPRQQLNLATSFIDGSVVYGNSDLKQKHLRTFQNGTLRTFLLSRNDSDNNNTNIVKGLLPISTNLEDGCNRVEMIKSGKYCFESGDDRANENLLLTSMHLLWVRQHNYLADGLLAVNSDWDDETVFQEARKILGAQMAHITYNEFLPILLGKDIMIQMKLFPQTEDDAEDTYDLTTNPTIANDFAAAGFRFAHSLLPNLLRWTSDRQAQESIELHRMLFNPFRLWDENGIDLAILMAIQTPVQRVDPFFSVEISQKLFLEPKAQNQPVCGLDLVTLNIQRGRDHGLPGYSVYRKHCGLKPVDTWSQMADAIDKSAFKTMQQIYKLPQDVDVYTGALSEPPLNGSIFGPLLTCIVADQFWRLKHGDSHWYERKFGPQRFSKVQLNEIYQTTLSEIICQNSDNIQQIQKFVMVFRKDQNNPTIDCQQLQGRFNFTLWNRNKKQKSEKIKPRIDFGKSTMNVRAFHQHQLPEHSKSNHLN